jgi:hypothetical protein
LIPFTSIAQDIKAPEADINAGTSFLTDIVVNAEYPSIKPLPCTLTPEKLYAHDLYSLIVLSV